MNNRWILNRVCLCLITGEVTAEELRQRLDGAKERVSSQPRPETRPQSSEAEGSSGKDRKGWFWIQLLSYTSNFTLNDQLDLYAINTFQAESQCNYKTSQDASALFSNSAGA